MKNIRRHLSARKNDGMAPQHLKRPQAKALAPAPPIAVHGRAQGLLRKADKRFAFRQRQPHAAHRRSRVRYNLSISQQSGNNRQIGLVDSR